MLAGKLTNQICIRSPKEKLNEYNEKVITYSCKSHPKANCIFKNGTRTTENGEIVHFHSMLFEVRLYVDVSVKDIIYFNERLYRIISIEPNKPKQKKIIFAEVMNE